MLKLGGIPVYRTNSKGMIYGAIEEFKELENYILVIAPEAGTEPVAKFRSGFYFLAKGLNIPYVPIEIDFKNRRFKIHQYKYCLLYTSPSPRDQRGSRMPSSA